MKKPVEDLEMADQGLVAVNIRGGADRFDQAGEGKILGVQFPPGVLKIMHFFTSSRDPQGDRLRGFAFVRGWSRVHRGQLIVVRFTTNGIAIQVFGFRDRRRGEIFHLKFRVFPPVDPVTGEILFGVGIPG